MCYIQCDLIIQLDNNHVSTWAGQGRAQLSSESKNGDGVSTTRKEGADASFKADRYNSVVDNYTVQAS
jgi:hypothetical protein